MEELTGISAERALGGTAFDMAPGVRGPGRQLLEAALDGQIVSSGDLFLEIEETGRSGWVVGTYGPHRNAAGEIVGVIGVIRSVTERRRNEQALRESEQRFRRMADAAPVMIWMDDADGMSTYFNKPWLDFTGRTLARGARPRLARRHPSGRPGAPVHRGLRRRLHGAARVPDGVPAAPRRRRVPLGPRDGDAAVHRVRGLRGLRRHRHRHHRAAAGRAGAAQGTRGSSGR